MKILFLAHRTPYPPNKGDKIRSFHLLSQLAKRHHVTLAYWVDAPEDFAHAKRLETLCKGPVIPVPLSRLRAAARAVSALARGKSFSEGYYIARSFRRALAPALRTGPFDVVFAFSSAMALYCEKIQAPIKVIDFVDVDSDKWGQLAKTAWFPLSTLYRVEERRLCRLEAEIAAWASRSVFVSAADAALFRQRIEVGNIEILPNGVDLDLRRLPLEPMAVGDSEGKAFHGSDGPRLIFVGTMNYLPNIDAARYFVEQIFPRIRRALPSASVEIVGRYPTRAVSRLGYHAGVKVIGEVAEVRSYLLRADVSIAPLRIARGVQNKVLEAMAVGVPVVATSAAIQGIDVSDGQEVLVGDDSETFARQVLRLLSDAELRRTITKKASSKMRQMYDWDQIGEKLDRFLTGASVSPIRWKGEAGISGGRG